MKKDYLMDGNRIMDCMSNTARMSLWELLKFRLPRLIREPAKDLCRAIKDMSEALWTIFCALLAFLVGLPLFLLLWPLIGAKEIRTARRAEARAEAKETGKTSVEVHRMKFGVFEHKKLKRWVFTMFVDNLGLPWMIGIPSFDYTLKDYDTGALVFYRVKEVGGEKTVKESIG